MIQSTIKVSTSTLLHFLRNERRTLEISSLIGVLVRCTPFKYPEVNGAPTSNIRASVTLLLSVGAVKVRS
jgi:hypothetical protein